MPCRSIKFQENYKFKDYESPGMSGSSAPNKDMGAFIQDLKANFKTVDYVYMWHALCGYWGKLRPNIGPARIKVIAPKLSPKLQKTMEDLVVDKIVNNGIGLVSLKITDQLYEALHSNLESVGIDGVKVDLIHVSS